MARGRASALPAAHAPLSMEPPFNASELSAAGAVAPRQYPSPLSSRSSTSSAAGSYAERRRASESAVAAAFDARRAARAAKQCAVDERLHNAFESLPQGQALHCSAVVEANRGAMAAGDMGVPAPTLPPRATKPSPSSSDIRLKMPIGGARVAAAPASSPTGYLQSVHCGGLIQSFGCMLLLEETSLTVLAYSENAPRMLGASPGPELLRLLNADASANGAGADAGGEEPGTGCMPTGRIAGAPAGDPAPPELHRRSSVGASLRALSARIQKAIALNRAKTGRWAPGDQGTKTPKGRTTTGTGTGTGTATGRGVSPGPSLRSTSRGRTAQAMAAVPAQPQAQAQAQAQGRGYLRGRSPSKPRQAEADPGAGAEAETGAGRPQSGEATGHSRWRMFLQGGGHRSPHGAPPPTWGTDGKASAGARATSPAPAHGPSPARGPENGRAHAQEGGRRRGSEPPVECLTLPLEEESFLEDLDKDASASTSTMDPEPEPAAQTFVGLGAPALPLFTPDSVLTLQRALAAPDVSIMNPLLVQAASPGEGNVEASFYAALHRTEDGILVDLEPIRPQDQVFTGEGTLQAHRLASQAIARLEKVPAGKLQLLCETVCQGIRQLSGYDRVMAYQFHDDDHGEVVAEDKAGHMETYVGLHYPATDVPQATRALFFRNRVRAIVDRDAPPVRVLQDSMALRRPMSLADSNLRAVHGCHVQYLRNMGIRGTIALATLIKPSPAHAQGHAQGLGGSPKAEAAAEQGRRLWGLVVCHHLSAKYLPYPVRLACEFLMQAFSLRVNLELERQALERERDALRMQSLLCDMLLRDSPTALATQHPSIQDLLPCDGAALFWGGSVWSLGVGPTREQLLGLIAWLQRFHGTASGFGTDSLRDSGYPGAEELEDDVCGVLAACLPGGNCLLWFRSAVERHVTWSGAKHDPSAKDDWQRMNPRASFAAFLEVVRHRSPAWSDLDIEAARSLGELITVHLQALGPQELAHMEATRLAKTVAERMRLAEGELSRILETATAPVLTVDAQGCITAWNARLEQLTGLSPGEAMGMSLLDNLAHPSCKEAVSGTISKALRGEKTEAVEMRLRVGGATGRGHSNPSSPGVQRGVLTSPGKGHVVDAAAAGRRQPEGTPGAAPAKEVVLLMTAFVSLGSKGAETEAETKAAQEEKEGETEKGEGREEPGGGEQRKEQKEGKGGERAGEEKAEEAPGVCFMGQDLTALRAVQGQFTRVKGDYKAIVHSRNSLIPPIFAVDSVGLCVEWNPAMEALAGLAREEALGQVLLGGVFGTLLRVKGDDRTRLAIQLSKGAAGMHSERSPVAFLNRQGALIDALLTVAARRTAAGEVLGAFCFLQTPSSELSTSLSLHRAAEEFGRSKAQAVAYLRGQIRGPLDGLKHLGEEMAKWPHLSPMAQSVLSTSFRCQQQVARILSDTCISDLEEGFTGVESEEFRLDHVVETVARMGQQGSTRRALAFRWDTAESVGKCPPLLGDAVRLQQALGNMVASAMRFTPAEGWVVLRASTEEAETHGLVQCTFRVQHSGSQGLPPAMVDQMLGCCQDKSLLSQEGLGLAISRQFILSMNGDVVYQRSRDMCTFLVQMSFPLSNCSPLQVLL